jgi:hypothetical protein
MMGSMRPGVVATFGLALAAATVASAHHSVAAFDRDNPTTLSGTVKQFRFTNPHTWIYLVVPDGNGIDSQWDLEGAPVSTITRQGWSRDTLQPGMKVKLLIAPRKDGAVGGEWLQVLEIDGRPFQVRGR